MQESHRPSPRGDRTRFFFRAALVLLYASLTVAPARVAAQATPPEPRREQLLNGLRILLVQRPGERQAVLKLRVHSGAAFDLSGKEGTMALLADALFPDPATREYVTGDLQGRLEVSTGYDSIDVLLSGRAEEFERLVELLRNAVLNTQLSPEVFTRLRDSRQKTLRELSVSPETLADRAISARLYGAYPYGRLTAGTPESLARVAPGDLIHSRDRFLNADNSTLVVIGVEEQRALRALRQFLGAWRKSERVVPATFRQPEPVDPRTLVVDLPGVPDAELRLAARGLARADRDAPAALVITELARERWLTSLPELKGRAVNVRHVSHAVGGSFVMGASLASSPSAAQALASARSVLDSLAKTPPAAAELEGAKRAVVAALNKQSERPEGAADAWLDEHTYGSPAATPFETARAVAALTPGDIQRVAAKLFQAHAASVAVGDASRLREDFARVGEVEIFGAKTAKEEAKPTQPAPLKAASPKRP